MEQVKHTLSTSVTLVVTGSTSLKLVPQTERRKFLHAHIHSSTYTGEVVVSPDAINVTGMVVDGPRLPVITGVADMISEELLLVIKIVVSESVVDEITVVVFTL